ncbi:MAG: PAS domain S-box protein [Spirochaetota bacterium]|nr:PAS domain S-box protein [Spirochaetota bacterium]
MKNPSQNIKQSEPCHIIIVEYNESDTILLMNALNNIHTKCQAQTLKTLRELRSLLTETSPQLIIADYSLPDGDAVDIMEIIEDKGLNIPVIVCTGNLSEEVAVRCLKAGAVNYVVKDRLYRLAPAVQSALEASNIKIAKAKAEKALQKSVTQYKTIFDSAALGIAYATVERDFIEVNEAFCRITGYSREELSYMSFCDITHPDDLKENMDLAEKLVDGKLDSYQMEKRYIRKDEEIIWAHLSVSPEKDPQGKVIRLVGIIKDISERKKLEEELRHREQFLKTLSDSLPMYISFMNREFRYEFVNQYYLDNFMLKREEVMGKHLRELIGQEAFEKFLHRMEMALHGTAQNFEDNVTLKNNKNMSLNLSYIPYRNELSEVVGYFAIVRDISQEKLKDNQLKESYQLLQSTFSSLSGVVFVVDPATRVIEMCNSAMKRVFGYLPEEVIGKNTLALHCDEESYLKFGQMVSESLDKKGFFHTEFMMKHRTGELIYTEHSITEIKDPQTGKRLKLVGVATDITKRKLRELEIEKLSLTVEQSENLVMITDVTGMIEYMNPAFERVTGYSKEECLGKKPSILKSGQHDNATYKEMWGTILSGKLFRCVLCNKKKNGDLYYEDKIVSSIKNEAGEITHFVSTSQDITDKLRVEHELSETQLMYHTLEKLSPVGLFQTNAEGYCVQVNKRWSDISGLSLSEALSEGWANALHHEDRDRVVGTWNMAVSNSWGFKQQYRFVDQRGKMTWVLGHAIPYKDDSGQVMGYIGSVTDISAQKAQEEELFNKWREFETLVENSPDIIARLGRDFRYTFLNKAIEDIDGLTSDMFIGKTNEEIGMDAGLCEQFNRALENVFKTVQTQKIEGHYLAEDLYFEVILVPELDIHREVNTALLIARNITDLKETEKEKDIAINQFIQAQRLEAVVALAGGIAHDFNNIMVAVKGFAEVAIEKVLQDNLDAESIANTLFQLTSSSDRAVNLAKKLLMFSRKQDRKHGLIQINGTINSMLDMLYAILKDNIRIEIDLTDKLWAISADEANIEQVILNLVINAGEAMPDGGEITISTKNVEKITESCLIQTENPLGPHICLTVSDNGPGIPEDIRMKIFEPFFSSKENYQATGLGLSVVYGIVKEHNGCIQFLTDTGKGTSFKLYFPAQTKLEAYKKPDPSLTVSPGEMRPRILLVEDDNGVRELSKIALSDSNYEVITAATAYEAMKEFDRHNGMFDLVFSDIILPDRTAIRLVEEFTARKHDLKILLTSGHVDEASQRKLFKGKSYNFLPKPFDLDDMLNTVRRLIESGKN